MGTGTNQGNSPKTFLSVGFGRLRQKTLSNKQKVDKDTPNAVKRTTNSGNESWSLEFDYITGIIENIFYKEDSEYGNSFEVVISDAADTFQVSFQEESRFCQDLLKKLPNIDLTKDVKITVYDFVDKENKRKVGTSIEQDGVKIQSYYSEKDDDGKWTLLHGFPVSDGVDFHDKDDLSVYMIKVKKFLRSEFNSKFADKFGKKPETHVDNTEAGSGEPDDLPF